MRALCYRVRRKHEGCIEIEEGSDLKNIQEDIKTGNFKSVYLLYGEEAYLKQQYKQNLVKALNPDEERRKRRYVKRKRDRKIGVK